MWMLLGCIQEPKSPDIFDVDESSDIEDEHTDESDTADDTAAPVSYTHLTLPTICSV